jgi:ubiquinone/menaquinone biosynthesis C-methylase UbiE
VAEKEGNPGSNDVRCAYCRYWTRHDGAEGYKTQKFAGHCSHPFYALGDKVRSDGFSLWAGDKSEAFFQTGEDFHCKHFAQDTRVLKVPLPGGKSDLAKRRQKTWEDVSDNYLKDSYRTEEVLKSKWIVDNVLAKYEFSRLLEIGCGTGRNLAVVKEKMPTVELWGMDICRRAYNMARARVGKAVLKVASVYHLPPNFIEDYFDMVLICSVFMFVPPGKDLAQAVSEVKRVAKRYIVQVEWCREGENDKELTWNRDYTHMYEPEFKVIDMKSLAYAYIEKDLPLMLWCFERVQK